MSDELQVIEGQLGTFEQEVAEKYRECAWAQGEKTPLVRFPDEVAAGLRTRLERLRAALFATGEPGKLRLVSERHDDLRIRMVYIDQLLRYDIPRPYLEQALKEYAPQPGRGKAPVAPVPATRAVPTAPPAPGLLAGLLGLFAALFGRGRAAPAAPATKRPARGNGNSGAPRPGHEMRLIYLHKLMEEDAMHLIPPGRRPPRVASDVKLPEYIANFSARDFAETHFGVRSKTSAEPVARTPEELRAKLAKRGKL